MSTPSTNTGRPELFPGAGTVGDAAGTGLNAANGTVSSAVHTGAAVRDLTDHTGQLRDELQRMTRNTATGAAIGGLRGGLFGYLGSRAYGYLAEKDSRRRDLIVALMGMGFGSAVGGYFGALKSAAAVPTLSDIIRNNAKTQGSPTLAGAPGVPPAPGTNKPQISTGQKEAHRMNSKLQAGIELVVEKTAAQEQGIGLLSGALQQKIATLQKQACGDGGVQVTRGSSQGQASSGGGAESKNSGYGKGEQKLDDDPTKGGKGKPTGATNSNSSGANFTVESNGMPDLSLPKTASAKVMATMLRSAI